MENIEKDKKLYILLGLLLIIVFAIVISLIRNNINSKVDYNSDSVVADLLKSATITYDREVYFVMENIITKYISSYEADSISGVANYEEYYNVLDDVYKSKLGKKKYKEVAQNFFKSVEYVDNTTMDRHTTHITTNIIRNIYDLGSNKYLCAVGLISSTEYGYIGISVNPSKNSYEIFYLE